MDIEVWIGIVGLVIYTVLITVFLLEWTGNLKVKKGRGTPDNHSDRTLL